jgi:hypothetical protein
MYSSLPTYILLKLFSLALNKDFGAFPKCMCLFVVCSSVNKVLTEESTLQDHIAFVQQGNINVAAVAEIEDYIVSEHKRQ